MFAGAMNNPDPNLHDAVTGPAPVMPGVDPMHDPAAAEWERTYGTFLHLTLILTHLVPVPVVPAAVMWLVKRDASAFVNDHGKEAVNFHLSLLIYAVVGGILVAACGIGFAVLIAVYVLGIYGMIAAAVAANKGRYYRYPMCLRLIA